MPLLFPFNLFFIFFEKKGLIELSSKLEESKLDLDGREQTNKTKAMTLLGELLYLSSYLLPTNQCGSLQSLPTLVKNAITYTSRIDNRRMRTRASTIVNLLHSYSGIKKQSSSIKEVTVVNQASSLTGSNRWKRLKGSNRRLDRIDDIRLKLEWRLDENTIRTRITETGILNTKDYTKWNWEALIELLEGPLTNPAKTEIALKTKLFKRMLSFLRPENKQFSTLSRNRDNQKYVIACCEALEVLALTETGGNLLSTNKLLPSIISLLKEECEYLSSHSNPKERDPQRPLSEDSVLKTMTREYFTILGSLSTSVRGIKLLKNFKVFQYFSQLLARDDLCSLILVSLDYNTTFSRMILKSILSIQSPVMRYLATRHLLLLYRAGVNAFATWGIELALQQMEDKNKKVRQAAISLLYESSANKECLKHLIASKKGTYFLSAEEFKEAKYIVYRFLSLPEGFSYLSENSFIQTQVAAWKNSKNVLYAKELEQAFETGNKNFSQKRKTGKIYIFFGKSYFFGQMEANFEDGGV